MKRRIGATALAVALTVILVACGTPDQKEPTLGTVDFTPKLVLTIKPDALVATVGPRPDPAVTVDASGAAAVGSGTVVDIVNGTDRERRLQGNGGKVFDTGVMRPAASTTVVLTNDTGRDLVVEVTEVGGALRTTITVHPPPTPK